MALIGANVFLPLFFQLVEGASPSIAGLMVAPLMGGLITSSMIGGRLVSATGRYKIFAVWGLATASIAYAVMAFVARYGSNTILIEAALALLGIGIGLVMPNLTTAIQNAVARAHLGGCHLDQRLLPPARRLLRRRRLGRSHDRPVAPPAAASLDRKGPRGRFTLLEGSVDQIVSSAPPTSTSPSSKPTATPSAAPSWPAAPSPRSRSWSCCSCRNGLARGRDERGGPAIAASNDPTILTMAGSALFSPPSLPHSGLGNSHNFIAAGSENCVR